MNQLPLDPTEPATPTPTPATKPITKAESTPTAKVEGTPTAKTGGTPTAKAEGTPKPESPPATKKKSAHESATKAQLVNPAWASEIVRGFGLSGPLADAVADKLVAAVSEHLSKITKPEKLTKLVREAVSECIGKVGFQ
jgi:hypothetical protein